MSWPKSVEHDLLCENTTQSFHVAKPYIDGEPDHVGSGLS